MYNNDSISILGSTGSIGVQALQVAEHLNLKIDGIAFGRNTSSAIEQINLYKPKYCAVTSDTFCNELKEAAKANNTKLFAGKNAIEDMLSCAKSGICVNGIGGIAGLLPTISALKHCGRVCLANKESLVAAGDIIAETSLKYGSHIVPVDSEHSAIFQCLNGEPPENIDRLIITCSGGAFYGYTKEQLEKVTPEQAITHPNWKMGKVITVNCATLMNKGLEVIEASRLFGIKESNIDVVIHRESIIHSMVEFKDGTIKAEMSAPDMRFPIQYAIEYPFRTESCASRIKLQDIGKLTFSEPDTKTFPLLELAREALRKDGVIPCVMNAANETAVELFLDHRIKLTDIFEIVTHVTDSFENIKNPSLEDILKANEEAKEKAKEYSGKYLS